MSDKNYDIPTGGPGGSNAVGGPVMQVSEPTPGGGQIPFRRATTFRTTQLQQTTGTITTGAQQVDVVIEGSGFIYGIDLRVEATTAGNAAATAYQEDAPWSALDSVVFRDVNGELINVSGYHLRLVNMYGGYLGTQTLDTASTDATNIYRALTGAAATGGSFRFHLFLPCGLNRRTLTGVLGNQDRAQKYSLRTDLAASTAVYSTPPTTLPPYVVARTYENYAVPAPTNANGVPQQNLPDNWGVLHYITQSVSPSAPAAGTVNHYLSRLGNTIRLLILVVRQNGSRISAEGNMPTRIQFNLGDTPIFVEDTQYRRMLMYRRYGFDAPAGVLVYDFATDLLNTFGNELGDDWQFTNGLVNAQFQLTYPAGIGSTNNSLTIITEDLVIPPDVDVYANA